MEGSDISIVARERVRVIRKWSEAGGDGFETEDPASCDCNSGT
jgi:hypothetical protein